MAGGRRLAGALGLILALAAAARAAPPRVIRARAIEAGGPVFDAAVQPRLRVDFAVSSAAWVDATGRRPFLIERHPAPDGDRLALRLDPPPEGPGHIVLRGARTARIAARWLPRRLREAVRARGRVRRGDPQAWATGRAILDDLGADPWVLAEGLLLDVARSGIAAVDPTPIVSRLEREAPAVAAWLMRVLTQHFGRAGHFRQAEAWAARARRSLPAHDPISAHLQAALDAQVSLWGGRSDRALQQIRQALDGATRLGDDDRRFHYEQLQTDILAGLGAHVDAVALAERLHAERPSPATAVGRDWQILDAMRRCALPQRFELLVEPLERAAFDARHSQWVRQAAAINGLLAATAAGQAERADRLAVEAVRLNQRGPWVALARLSAAERAAQRGDWKAARTGYRAVLADAARRFGGVATDETWQALHGLGRLARDRAAPGLAALFFDAALAALDEASRAATARRHRADWFADRRRLVLDAVRNRLHLGLDRAALVLLDRYRAPATRTLLEDSRIAGLAPSLRAAWDARIDAYEAARAQHAATVADCEGAALDDHGCQASLGRSARAVSRRFEDAHRWLDTVAPPLAAPGLPVLAPDQVALMQVEFVAPGACDRRIGFVARLQGGAVEVAPTELPARWLADARDASHVFLVGDRPEVRGVPQRRLPDGRVWGEAVSHSFVPSLGWLARPRGAPAGRPLAVIDPDGSMQRALPTVLARDPLVLRGPAATRRQTLAALDGAAWFVFDGHGVVQDDAWRAHLALADGPLTVADLLARRPQVGTAVLSGCDSGRGARWSRTERLGLADAFLLAGTQAALATDVQVPVEAAARVVEAFVAAGGLTQPGPAWRAVVGRMRRAGDDAWRKWRLFGWPAP